MNHPKGEMPSFKKRTEYGKKQTPNGLVCKNFQTKKQDQNKSSFLTFYDSEHSLKQQVECGKEATSALIAGNLRKKEQEESKSPFLIPNHPELKNPEAPKVDSNEGLFEDCSIDDLIVSCFQLHFV